jgi:hypothetical protein
MAVYTFDGPNKRITLPASTVIDVKDLYSRWKDWVKTSDNSKYLPAFSVVGGDPISEDTNLAVNVFIQNNLGWRIAPPETDIDIALVGNLYPATASVPWRAPAIGDYQTSINTDNSVNAIVVTTGGGSIPSASEIAEAVWEESMANHNTSSTFGRRLKELFPAYWGIK